MLRPNESPYGSAEIRLQGLDSGSSYKMKLVSGNGGEKILTGDPIFTGSALATGWSVKLAPQLFAIYRYERAK